MDHLQQLICELSNAIIVFFRDNHISYDLRCESEMIEQKDILHSRWNVLCAYYDRTIFNTSKKLHFSKEFESSKSAILPDNYYPILADILRKIENGEDVRSNLSTAIFNSCSFDYLLNHWNIRHLHISNQTGYNANDMHNNRSDFLLFMILTEQDAYLLDIRRHPHGSDWTARSFLTIALNNGWMEYTGLCCSSDVIELEENYRNLSDDDIYDLYKNHLNVFLQVGEKVFIDKGVSLAGYRIEYLHELGDLYIWLCETSKRRPTLGINGISMDEKGINISVIERKA